MSFVATSPSSLRISGLYVPRLSVQLNGRSRVKCRSSLRGDSSYSAAALLAGMALGARRSARKSDSEALSRSGRRHLCRLKKLHAQHALSASSRDMQTEKFLKLQEASQSSDEGSISIALQSLKAARCIKLFDSYPKRLPARQISLQDLKSMGILAPERIQETPDNIVISLGLGFFFGISSLVASSVLSGQAYADAVVSILLALTALSIIVGSFFPQPLASLVSKATGFADEEKRAAAHEAGHFLVGYLLGAPILAYSVAAGKPAVQFSETSGPMAGFRTERTALDVFCVVSCAGIAGECLLFEGSQGGQQDLDALSKVLKDNGVISNADLRGEEDQDNFLRWGVFYAASMLRAHPDAWNALREAMLSGDDLAACVQALEAAEAIAS